MELMVYYAVLITGVIISVRVAYMSYWRRPAEGSLPLSVLMASVALWIAAHTLHYMAGETYLKVFFINVQYFGIVIIPLAWFVLAMQYTKRAGLLTGRNLTLLSVLPAITLIIVWTNQYHGLFKIGYRLATVGSLTTIISTYNTWFWVHTAYSYMLLLTGTVLLLAHLFRSRHIYRGQAVIMLVGMLAPFIGNALFIFGFLSFLHIDITPWTLLISGVLFYYGLFQYKLLDLIPIAHDAVIESIRDVIIVLDMQDRVADINPAAMSMIGRGTSKIIGQPVAVIFPGCAAVVQQFQKEADVNEKISLGEGEFWQCYDLRITPLYDRKGGFTGRLLILRNITELERTMKELESSRKAAEDASKAKSRFLANMSHEIRTPMNGIIGAAEVLCSTNLSGEQEEYVEVIKGSAESLLSIIDDILDVSKIEAGKMELEKVGFDLRQLLANLSKTFSIQCNKLNLQFILNISETVPGRVCGDPVRLQQILFNLVGNSVKFTGEGVIEVRVEVLNRKDNQILLRFWTIDTGIGMPRDRIKNLFGSFIQLDSSTRRKYGGTGLGLAIVKNLVGLMGGSIKVESDTGKGTAFYFDLPFEVCLPDSRLPEKKAYKGESLAGYNILLAEDNISNQLIMKKLLTKKGLAAGVAENGRKVLELFKTGEYHLIMMDLQMPVMDGLEATAAIRELEKASGGHIPVIALTANAMKGDREKCIEAGMDDYLAKPIKPDQLYSVLARHLIK